MSEAPLAELALDDEQAAAVDSDDPAIAVLAGPGSGKTRVLSYRTRRLLGLDGSSRALLLTFTNKAAAEMKARALGVANVTSDRISASTFHTFGLQVLHAHGDLLDVGRDFETIDDQSRSSLSEEVARHAGTTDRYRRWSFLRLRRRTTRDQDLLRFGRAYEAAKREQHLVDFDDLIVCTATLFEEHPEVAAAYAARYQHILVDEFQDTNAAQFAIVRALANTAKTVSVFADDDQAIYRFAGAEAENVRRFLSELGATEFALTVNYRCREAIVERANRLIAADPNASGRRMRSFYAGGEVLLRVFPTMQAEAEQLVHEVAGLIDRQEVAASEVAILARAAFRLQPLLVELERSGTPVSNWLGVRYESEERRTLGTCLSVVRGAMTDRQVERFCTFLGIPETDERDPIALLEANAEIPAALLLGEVRRLAWQGASVGTIVRAAQTATAEVDPTLAASFDPILESIAAFERSDPEFSLEHFLSELTLGGVGGAPTVGGGVKIASLHRTKGLQWPHVYILGLEEGRLPDFRAETDDDLRDERRTCFVGVCRAERRLTLTRTQLYGRTTQTPSRFLSEMGF